MREDSARRAFFAGELGNPSSWVDFGKDLPAVSVNDIVHDPRAVLRFARRIGAMFDGKYLVIVGDGRPCLYTEAQLLKLFHP